MKIFKMLKADWMKSKNSSLRIILYSTPILYAIIMIMYNNPINIQVQNYAIFFNTMAIILPIGISLISMLIVEQEFKAGYFSGMFYNSSSRISIYISKLLMLFIIISIEIIITTLLFTLGFKFILKKQYIDIFLFIKGALFMCLGSYVICSIYLFTSFKLGIGATLSLGAIGILLVAIIGGTPIGYNIWEIVPWTFSIKLVELPAIFFNGVTIPFNLSPEKYFYNQLTIGIISSTIFFFLINLIALLWFNKWDGKKI